MVSKVKHCKLVASCDDFAGYITYVFINLDLDNSEYFMCVRYPNWEHPIVNLEDRGFLHFIEVEAGKDSYWNGKEFIPYNYTNCQFIKFIPEFNKRDNKDLIID